VPAFATELLSLPPRYRAAGSNAIHDGFLHLVRVMVLGKAVEAGEAGTSYIDVFSKAWIHLHVVDAG
jgi:hypothetical protein